MRGFLALLLACGGLAAAAGEPSADRRISGFATMHPDTQAMQRSDRLNPAMLWVAEGARAWTTPAGPAGQSCASCHGEAVRSMAGAAARYPVVDAATGKPRDLAGQIRACRSERQRAGDWAPESRPLLAMEAFLGLQSRGQPILPALDSRLEASIEAGRALFNARIGQLNLSCAGCHEDNAGRRLGGSLIPQGHPTGYPIYRLEWQGLGSLQRRLRNCMTGVRAEPYPYGSAELIALELYLKRRAAGMVIETPAVRP